jgi:SAM-dependent methyltransferase
MSMLKSLLRSSINLADRYFGLRKLMQEENTKAKAHPLSGDRAIEWSWVAVHLPANACHVLDLGCVGSVLTGIASRFGHQVTAVDLNDIEYEMPRVTFRKGDIDELDFDDRQFDVIMNCSMIEHVGLENRYGSRKILDGDLMAMEKLGKLLAADGRMILTIPVGVDANISPFHRIYGTERLPKLLAAYRILQEEFWTKGDIGIWNQCGKETALLTKGSADHYALGLFLLLKRN